MKHSALFLAGAALSLLLSLPVGAVSPITGKLVALDAGHGGAETGACNATYPVCEKDVNLAVVYAFKEKLEAPGTGAIVIVTRTGDETFDSRKSRVDYVIEQCQTQYDRKCDILVSIHHNGSTDPTHDGTMVIYNERQDKPLATALHDALVPLTGKDEGYDNGGYGITVYGHLVSALTEAYYISNNDEVAAYLAGSSFVTPSGYTVLIGDRVNQEAQALFDGISRYFATKTSGGKGKPR